MPANKDVELNAAGSRGKLSTFVVAIPARLGSKRLPGKPLRLLAGEPLIRHVARRALQCGAKEVVVASDASQVLDAVADLEVRGVRTSSGHPSGTDRLAECAELCGWPDDTAIVNLQGDEPFAPVAGVRACAQALDEAGTPMATLATPLREVEELFSPDCVKVVRDRRGRALYFSRAAIPWARESLSHDRDKLPRDVPLLRHIGIYAYRAGFLRTFADLAPGALERAESLEQLRALEYGYDIAVQEVDEVFPAGIDNADDLLRAEQAMEAMQHA